MNDFCLVKTVVGPGQGVVIRPANAANRGFDPSIRQSFGIANGQILPAAVGVVNEATFMSGAAIMQYLFQCIYTPELRAVSQKPSPSPEVREGPLRPAYKMSSTQIDCRRSRHGPLRFSL